MLRAKKQELVAALHDTFGGANLVVVTHQTGLTVAETDQLRRQMRQAGAHYRVTKNRLARRALAGTPNEPIAELFQGPTAIAWSVDPLAAAKVMVEFAKKSGKVAIVGGALQGKLIDEAEVRALASLPSLDELRAKLLGLINAPATKLVSVLQAPPAQIARVLRAHADKEGAE